MTAAAWWIAAGVIWCTAAVLAGVHIGSAIAARDRQVPAKQEEVDRG